MKKIVRLLFTFVFMFACLCAQALESGETIRLVLGNKSVLVGNSSLDENKPAVLWTETNVNSQRWTLTAKSNGTFLLQNDYTNLYLGGLTSGSTGKVGQINKSSTTSKGSWDFVPVEGTTNKYYIYQGTTRKYALAVPASPVEGDTLLLVNTLDEDNPVDQSRITWTVRVVNQIEKAFTKDKRDDMMKKWKNRSYLSASVGHVIGGGGWWGDAEMFEIVLDALETTGDQQYATMFDELYRNFIYRKQSIWYQQGVNGYNAFNDDIAWMCIACVRAYLLTGKQEYLTTSKTNFDGMFARADCYGNDLLQWKHNSGQGTNSCINGPAAVCACYLAIAEADESYYEKARKTYMAERGRLFEFKDGKFTGKVFDSYDQGTGKYNDWASTYNQGTNLGAAIMLYNHYGEKMFKDDADAIIRWSEANMANSKGIIHVCQTVQGDLCGFKGIMLRYLRMYAESFNEPSHYAWIAKNAYHAWNNRNSSGITSSAWLTKAEENFKHKEGNELKDFAHEGNMTCISAAFNCHLGAVDSHDAYAQNEAEDFNFVRNAPVSYSNNLDDDKGGKVGPMKDGHYIGYRRVDFGSKPASHINLRVKIALSSTSFDVYLDQPNDTDGTLLCTVEGSELSALSTWTTIQKAINVPVIGVHNLYFVSRATNTSGNVIINWWQFNRLNDVFADLTKGEGELTTSFVADDVSALTDGDVLTAYTANIEAGSETWIEYQSPSPMLVYGYQFYSGNDKNGNPSGWSLQASNDGENWETLHSMSDVTISVTGQCYRADIETANAYTHYRLLFNMNETQTKLSVSEWQLLGRSIDENDLTADGGTIKEGFEPLIDHVGETAVTSPLTAVYKPSGIYTLTSYSITIGQAAFAPTSWKLEGSQNGTSAWKVIDQQTEALFPYDNYTYVCRVKPETSYLYYRLVVNDEEAQITQWQLFGKFDFGNFYEDLTRIATIASNDGSDVMPLIDKDGRTCATIEGNDLCWVLGIPIPVRVIGFSLISGDNAELDPKNVILYGYDDSGTETQISNKTVTFPARGSRVNYTVSTTKLFKRFKLKINDEKSSVRLADFELYGTVIAGEDDPNLVAPSLVEASAPALSTSEAINRINDGNRLYHYRAAFTEPVSITYSFVDSVSINAYSITASKNEATRDPSSWILEARNDNENWTLLDSRIGETFYNHYATQFYPVETTRKYNNYRLTVTAVNGANQLQIGEFQLLNLQPVDPTGIDNRQITTDSSQQAIYNLAGQKIVNGKLPRGIYIINGKKLLIQ